ncbi:unnamed protein product, partial [Choristocarpus tenellus]
MFGQILDPIGYGLDLNSYYDTLGVHFLGKANAMSGPSNMLLNVLCFGSVFLILRSNATLALKV